MNLIEISIPRDSLTPDDRSGLATAIAAAVLGEGSAEVATAPEETMRRARAMTHVGFVQVDGWTTGSGPWQGSGAPPLRVTVTVPEQWREQMAGHVVRAVRGAVRRLDRTHGWRREPADLWVVVVGVADGSIGLGGEPSTADDVLSFMTEEFRARLRAGEVTVPDGVVLDPVCGMRVRLGRRALTLQHDGRTVGFCAPGCRDAYAREHGLPVPA